MHYVKLDSALKQDSARLRFAPQSSVSICVNPSEISLGFRNILYPTALEVIDDAEVWSRLKGQCDQIGYCSFTTGD